MKDDRCGIADVKFEDFRVLDTVWNKKDITFRVKNFPSKTRLSKKKVVKAIEKAFSMWENVSNLRFTRRDSGPADIELSFEKKEHGQDEIFRKGEHGHAFKPRDGDVHFSDDRYWTLEEYNGINLLGVALHEIGHSIGLDHSSDSNAVMAPFYRGWHPYLKLTEDDIQGINQLYK